MPISFKKKSKSMTSLEEPSKDRKNIVRKVGFANRISSFFSKKKHANPTQAKINNPIFEDSLLSKEDPSEEDQLSQASIESDGLIKLESSNPTPLSKEDPSKEDQSFQASINPNRPKFYDSAPLSKEDPSKEDQSFQPSIASDGLARLRFNSPTPLSKEDQSEKDQSFQPSIASDGLARLRFNSPTPLSKKDIPEEDQSFQASINPNRPKFYDPTPLLKEGTPKEDQSFQASIASDGLARLRFNSPTPLSKEDIPEEDQSFQPSINPNRPKFYDPTPLLKEDIPEEDQLSQVSIESDGLARLRFSNPTPLSKEDSSEEDTLSQASSIELNNPKLCEPTTLLKESSVAIEKDGVCEVAPIKVEMDSLFDFLRINIASSVRPNIELRYRFHKEQHYRLDRDCLRGLACFLSYTITKDCFSKNRGRFNLERDRADFMGLLKEKIELFERFFPLTKKCKLFVEELIKIICEDENTNNCELGFFLKYRALIRVLETFYYIKHNDVFGDPYGFLKTLRKTDFSWYFTQTTHPDSRQMTIYRSFEKKLLELLVQMEILENNNHRIVKENIRNMKKKIEAVAKSTLNKNYISGEESFLDVMKRESSDSHLKLNKTDMKRIRDAWVRIKECITNNDMSVEVVSIRINDKEIQKTNISAAVDFLGSIVEEREKFFLGKWDSAKLPNDSEIRQCLVVNALTGLMTCGCWEHRVPYSEEEMPSDMNNLRDAFGQLTKKERMAVMCTEIKFRGRSFPLLPLLFLEYRSISDLTNIIKDFVPEVFNIKFQIGQEGKECDIIQLLEEMNNIRKKLLEKAEKERDLLCKKFLGEYLPKEENDSNASFMGYLDRSINELKKIKEELKSPENKTQEPQVLQEEPSTSMHQVEKVKQRSTCLPLL